MIAHFDSPSAGATEEVEAYGIEEKGEAAW